MSIWRLVVSKMSMKVLLINFPISLSSSVSDILVSWVEILSVKLLCCWYYSCVPVSHREDTRHLTLNIVNWENVSLLAEFVLHSLLEWEGDFQSCPVCPCDLTDISSFCTSCKSYKSWTNICNNNCSNKYMGFMFTN